MSNLVNMSKYYHNISVCRACTAGYSESVSELIFKYKAIFGFFSMICFRDFVKCELCQSLYEISDTLRFGNFFNDKVEQFNSFFKEKKPTSIENN